MRPQQAQLSAPSASSVTRLINLSLLALRCAIAAIPRRRVQPFPQRLFDKCRVPAAPVPDRAGAEMVCACYRQISYLADLHSQAAAASITATDSSSAIGFFGGLLTRKRSNSESFAPKGGGDHPAGNGFSPAELVAFASTELHTARDTNRS